MAYSFGSNTIKGSSGALTLPSTTDVLVARATIDTLTNKSISGATNTLTAIPQSAVTSLTTDLGLKAPLASPTFTGTVTVPTPVNLTDAATKAYVDANGVGTVMTVSVASANGFAGTVATATTTPAITLSTSITGMLKGNGTAISAATSGTDYSAGTSALATGILKSTTTTGALSIAVAGDFPTLNQNTSGNAATVTTNANLAGPITSVGNATSIASQTGTGSTFAMSASPTFTGTVTVTTMAATGGFSITGTTLTLGGSNRTLSADSSNTVLNGANNVYFCPSGTDGTRVVMSDGTVRVGGPGQTSATLNLASGGINMVLNTTTGTKIGTATTQKLALWNATPIVQPANTIGMDTVLTSTGLQATGGAALIDNDLKLQIVGKGIYIKEGSNATMGVATLVGGTVTVSTTKVTANSRIFVTTQSAGGTVAASYISARTAGTSFTITSMNVLDTSVVAWMIVEPA